MEILVRSERAEGWTAKSGGEKVPHGPLARVPSNPIFGAGSTPNPPLGKVREEATDEDLGHRRGLFAMAGAETRLLRIDMKQARIGQCDAMGIAAKIRKDLFRSAKGSLGLDDPGFAVEAVEEAWEGPLIRESLASAPQGQCAILMQCAQSLEQLAAESFRQCPDRK